MEGQELGGADRRWGWSGALQKHEGLSGDRGLRLTSGGPRNGNSMGTKSHVVKLW